MIKRLTLLKLAILTCIACNTLITANAQAVAANNKPLVSDKEPAWTKKTGARKFPSSTTIFSVNKYGAKGDAQTLNTKAIQAAIDACAKAGGDVVVFAPGSYVTGSLFLKSIVQLKLDKGVELLGSQDFADYPEIATRIAGTVNYAGGWIFKSVIFKGANGAALQVNDPERMKVDESAGDKRDAI